MSWINFLHVYVFVPKFIFKLDDVFILSIADVYIVVYVFTVKENVLGIVSKVVFKVEFWLEPVLHSV
jgi:hypothetical protein